METFIKKAIEKLNKNSESTLSDKDKKKIHEQFPIPREHKILWGQNLEQNNKYITILSGNFLIQTTLSCAKRVGIRLIYFLMGNSYLI